MEKKNIWRIFQFFERIKSNLNAFVEHLQITWQIYKNYVSKSDYTALIILNYSRIMFNS